MNNFNLVHNKLTNLNFLIEKNKNLDEIEIIVYRKNDISVFLKQLNSENHLKEINKISRVIKNLTEIKNLNISNSYLILTTENKINYEDFYLIERNNIILRKYVIRNLSDLERIPFMENEEIIKENKKVNKKNEDLIIESEKIVFSEINKNNGSYIDLNDDEIKNIAQKIMKGVLDK